MYDIEISTYTHSSQGNDLLDSETVKKGAQRHTHTHTEDYLRKKTHRTPNDQSYNDQGKQN